MAWGYKRQPSVRYSEPNSDFVNVAAESAIYIPSASKPMAQLLPGDNSAGHDNIPSNKDFIAIAAGAFDGPKGKWLNRRLGRSASQM